MKKNVLTRVLRDCQYEIRKFDPDAVVSAQATLSGPNSVLWVVQCESKALAKYPLRSETIAGISEDLERSERLFREGLAAVLARDVK